MPRELEDLEEEDQRRGIELSIAKKRALIAEAQKRYGKDWRRFIPFSGKGGSGVDWSSLKFKLGM